MSLVASLRPQMELAMKKRLENHKWLLKMQLDPSSFPYRPDPDGTALIHASTYFPDQKPHFYPTISPEHNDQAIYLILMPFFLDASGQDAIHRDFQRVLSLLKDESFGSSKKKSLPSVTRRLFVVIGMNRPSSLDEEKNEALMEVVKTLPQVAQIAYRVFGFYWKPQWKQNECIPFLYPVLTAYRLLKCLNKPAAQAVLKTFEQNGEMQASISEAIKKQTPFQAFRERIKNDRSIGKFILHCHTKAPNKLMYGVSMDKDILRLRTEGHGVFSHYDLLIAQTILQTGSPPSFASLGYRMEEQGHPAIALATLIDMKVREAMNRIIAQSSYLPDPCFLFNIKKTWRDLSALSFLGQGKTLEAKRMIENARRKKALNLDLIVFKASGSPLLETPTRMKPASLMNITRLDRTTIGQANVIKPLHAIAQSHAFPKQWAEQVYFGLDIHTSCCRSTTKHFMTIFSQFDPVHLAKGLCGALGINYNAKYFPALIANYILYTNLLSQTFSNAALLANHQEQLAQALADPISAIVIGKKHTSRERALQASRDFFTAGYEQLVDAQNQLITQGVTHLQIQRVVLAAKESGSAIHRVFADIMNA